MHIEFQNFYCFHWSLLNRVPCVPCVPAWSARPRANAPMCQKRTNFSFLRANVPINLSTSQRRANFSTSPTKRRTNLSKEFFFFWNFSIMHNIYKFLEYLGNCRKFISRNKERKFCYLQNFIKEKPY